MTRRPGLEAAPVRIPWTWGLKLYDQAVADALWSERTRVRGVVVDLGCGMQPHRRWLGSATTWVGCDLPSSASGRPAADVFAPAGAVPLRDGCADCVLSTQVIEHMPDPRGLFAEARRLLRPGGSLLVSAPQAEFLHEEPHDYWRFTRHGLARLAEEAGLVAVRVVPFGGAIALMGFLFSAHLPMLGASEGSAWQRVRHGVQAVVQRCADILDRRFYTASSTMGNLLVAERPA